MSVYLDKLEIQGFKSFPDRTVLKLHPGITAIVGPNGCGKSNIVDAVLWVLGEQKIKNLRGETNEDLIFSGSSQQKPLGMTEVGAYFTYQDKENYIARRYFRSDETKYILNDKICRHRDVMDSLYRMGIGDKKYFIFEQGSIEKLIALKPSEKRVLIEEAANISHYLNRKKQTAQKLIIAEQNLQNIEILLKDKADRLRELKNQVSYCKRYRRLKKEKVTYLTHFISCEYAALKEKLNRAQSAMESHLAGETVQKREISRLESKIVQLENDKWEEEKEVKSTQKERFDVNGKIYSISGEMDQIRQEMGFVRQRTAELQKAAGAAEEEIRDIDTHVIKDTGEREVLNRKIDEQKKSDDLIRKLEHQREKKSSIEAKLSDLNRESFPLQADLSARTNELLELEKKISRAAHEITSKENFIKELEEQIRTAGREKVKAEIAGLEKTLEKQQQENEKLRERYRTSQVRVRETGQRITDLTNEISNLELQKDKYTELRDKVSGKGTTAISTKNLGKVPEMMQTEPEYIPLLESFYDLEMRATALEKDSVPAANQLDREIYLLPREAGSLEDILPQLQKEEGFISTVKALYTLSLPEVKDRIKDGVLVDNLANGLRIFTRYGVDIVTRDCVIVTRDGILAGNRGKGILNVITEIRKIEEKIKTAISQKKVHQQQLESLNPDVNRQEKQLAEKNQAIIQTEKRKMQLETELDARQRTVATSQNRIEILRSEEELLWDQKKRLEKEWEAKKAAREQLKGRIHTLEKKKSDLARAKGDSEKEILRLDRITMEQRSGQQIIQQKIDFLDARISTFQQNRQKQQVSIKQFHQEITENHGKIEQLKQSLKSLEKDLAAAQKELQSLDDKIRVRETRLNELNKSIANSAGALRRERETFDKSVEKKNRIEIELSSIKKEIYILQERAFKELNTELDHIQCQPELEESPVEELKEKVEDLERRLTTMNESNRLNFSAESEYDLLEKDHNFHMTQREDILKSIGNMNRAIEKIDRESIVSFKEAFTAVKANFLKNFKILFEGGDAKLELIDEGEDLLESGLEIKAQPPGKRLQSLRLLSGGEKTLTSLAFLFSLFEYKPSPFCVFDEVDAALDEANILRFLKFLHKLKEKTQFLIITHNFKTMEEVDYLYGVSMDEPGVSKIFSVKMAEQKEKIKKNLKTQGN